MSDRPRRWHLAIPLVLISLSAFVQGCICYPRTNGHGYGHNYESGEYGHGHGHDHYYTETAAEIRVLSGTRAKSEIRVSKSGVIIGNPSGELALLLHDSRTTPNTRLTLVSPCGKLLNPYYLAAQILFGPGCARSRPLLLGWT